MVDQIRRANHSSCRLFQPGHKTRPAEKIDPDQSTIIAAVKSWLEQNDSWLLIFDNAQDPADLKDYLPKVRGGHVIDLMRSKGLRPVPVTIHGGDVVTKADDRFWRVPKRDLIATLQVAMETGSLQIAEGLELADVLVKELQNFRVKININSIHDTDEAWREGSR